MAVIAGNVGSVFLSWYRRWVCGSWSCCRPIVTAAVVLGLVAVIVTAVAFPVSSACDGYSTVGIVWFNDRSSSVSSAMQQVFVSYNWIVNVTISLHCVVNFLCISSCLPLSFMIRIWWIFLNATKIIPYNTSMSTECIMFAHNVIPVGNHYFWGIIFTGTQVCVSLAM